MTFVFIASNIGEELLWEVVGGILTSNQEKLIAVYIERGKRLNEEISYTSANTAFICVYFLRVFAALL